MDSSQVILELPIVIVGVAAIVSLSAFRIPGAKALQELSLLWVVNFLTDLAGHITRYYNIKNHWLYNCYFWVLYVVLAHLYHAQIQQKAVKTSIRFFYVLFPALVLVESMLFGIMDLQALVIVCGGVFMIYLAAAYFRQLYLSEETTPITRDPWFWFSFGFLVHFGGTVPFLGMLNYLYQHYPAFTGFYYLYISNSFTIFLNLLIITGYLCRRNYQRLH